MRFLMKVSIPTEAGNAAFKDGSFVRKLHGALEAVKPEAAYFIEEHGLRTAVLIVNMDEPSQIPALAEPFFLAMNARVTFHPAMLLEDLEKAGPGIQQAVEEFA